MVETRKKGNFSPGNFSNTPKQVKNNMQDIQAILQPTVAVLRIPQMKSLYPFVNHPWTILDKK